jgi:hypothetical protein
MNAPLSDTPAIDKDNQVLRVIRAERATSASIMPGSAATPATPVYARVFSGWHRCRFIYNI